MAKFITNLAKDGPLAGQAGGETRKIFKKSRTIEKQRENYRKIEKQRKQSPYPTLGLTHPFRIPENSQISWVWSWPHPFCLQYLCCHRYLESSTIRGVLNQHPETSADAFSCLIISPNRVNGAHWPTKENNI